VQYNRTVEISRLATDLGSIDCGTSPYSATAYEVDQALLAVEAQLADTSGGVPAAADTSAKKQTSKAGTVVAMVILLLLLLLLAAAMFVMHRRRQSETGAIPTAATLSNLSVASANAGYTSYANPMHNGAMPGGVVIDGWSNVSYTDAGAQGAAAVPLGSDVSALYAIPYDAADGGCVLANAHGSIENPTYDYLEVVGSSV
jgi:hypothetical protein